MDITGKDIHEALGGNNPSLENVQKAFEKLQKQKVPKPCKRVPLSTCNGKVVRWMIVKGK